MGKNKLQRFAENETFANLHQPPFQQVFREDYQLKGHWNQQAFPTPQPITLELGCGRGEYTLALAEAFPQRNFIGMDIKGARLWYGAKAAHLAQTPNVQFIRGRIETINAFFAPQEVSEIWITFPDPQLKTRREKKRLTSPLFLERYQRLLAPDGVIHLKTDSLELHQYTLSIIEQEGCTLIEAHANIDPILHERPELQIPTRYEALFREQGKPITYLAFRLPNA
ncbi:MAG: tRNA (guanosine(46)-N7)-methyltransferase TrmB [Bacteroidetes bacterium]|nr:MAG: tRNA (guanosine(46)-N7)-methyltransferase TrmB [Bacteroidota bacterium]